MSRNSAHRAIIKGRGAQSNPHNRFAATRTVACDDGWAPRQKGDSGAEIDAAACSGAADWAAPARGPDTRVQIDHSRSIISTNQSPDVPFEQSINPYKGCEHGCVYCFARPSHEYLDLSLGQDFETRLFYKPNAVALLEKHLARPSYRCRPIVLGVNTDAYQPLEKEKRLTRRLLETLLRHRHPVSLITKGSLILRDLDILAELARHELVTVMVSVTTLDNSLKVIMEPRTAAPGMRLKVIRELNARGVPVGLLFAPVIPCINDHELEAVVERCAAEGARSASFVMLRLPHQLKTLFEDWLEQHFPERKNRVLNRLRELHGGRLYDSKFGERMRGSGAYAELIRQRFELVARRHGLKDERRWQLRTDLFRVPGRAQQWGFDF